MGRGILLWLWVFPLPIISLLGDALFVHPLTKECLDGDILITADTASTDAVALPSKPAASGPAIVAVAVVAVDLPR